MSGWTVVGRCGTSLYASADVHSCMLSRSSHRLPSRMQWCHTDLGAMAFRRQRLLVEDVRLGTQAGGTAGPDHEHADGLLAARITEAGAFALARSAAGSSWVCTHALTCQLCVNLLYA